jgi:hypothetical protein
MVATLRASAALISSRHLPINATVSTLGMEAAQARVAEIKARIAELAPRPVPAGGAFGPHYAAALGELDAAATVRGPGDYGPIEVPPELAVHGNGRIPLGELLPIGDGRERLYGPAALAFRRMAADAWRAGVDLEVNDGYRALPDQHRLADDLGLYRNGGAAAVPGTSTHGWGLSVDIDTDGGAVPWLRANAARYGFVEDVPGEPWHWTFRPDR